MRKKLMLACMAIAAFAAFASASTASAATLTGNGVVPPGTSITAKNTGITTFTGFNIQCDHVHLTGTVTKNNTVEPIEAEIPVGWAKFNGTATNTDCTSALGPVKVTVNSKLCLKQVAGTDTFNTTGCGANVTFTLEITGTGPCRYSTASVAGTVTTNVTPATVEVFEQAASGAGEGNGFFCPANGKLDMDFDLYTTNGVGLTIS